MFTGLIQGIATILSVLDSDFGRRIEITLSESLSIGESVALNGVCCTVLPVREGVYAVDLLQETCKKTTLGTVTVGDKLNYERCVTPTTLLGGHMVQGHVDGQGQVLEVLSLGAGTYGFQIAYSAEFFPLLVPKGSITIDGISLTVVDVTQNWFSVHIIPHTWAHTVLHLRQSGAFVNLEYDIVGKYLYHFYTLRGDNG